MIGDDCVYSVHWMMGNAVQGCVYSLCGVTVSVIEERSLVASG